jgi:hypothetical protein
LGSSNSTKDKFTRFRLNRHKDKGKVSRTVSSVLFKRMLQECYLI